VAKDDGVTVSRQMSLTPDEMAEVLALKGVCDAYEGLDLKLGYGAADPAQATYPAVLLARVGAALVGYCSLDGDEAVAEMCGMVHPDWRRHHIGLRLFDLARAGFVAVGGRQIFAVCEDASATGHSFLRMLAGQRAFSEYRMTLRHAPSTSDVSHEDQSDPLTIERARPEDYKLLAAALARAFENTEERMLGDLTSASAIATEQVYVARRAGAIIGGFRLSVMPDSIGIYAFGIDPTYQRQGWGRRMLARACALAKEQGAAHVSLEVDTDNAAAIALYLSSGFEMTTTYGYYIFSPTLLFVGLGLDDESEDTDTPSDEA